jgi:hypothetical protein
MQSNNYLKMTTPIEWTVAVVGGLTVPYAVFRALGRTRARDPLLFIGACFVALRLLITIGQLMLSEGFDVQWFFATLIVAYLVRRRLRLFDSKPDPAAAA